VLKNVAGRNLPFLWKTRVVDGLAVDDFHGLHGLSWVAVVLKTKSDFLQKKNDGSNIKTRTDTGTYTLVSGG
jgi:hypothetical protein